MRRRLLPLPLPVMIAAIFSTGCSVPESSPTPEPVGHESQASTDPCVTQAADNTLYVPTTFSGETFPSASGFYGYGRNCNAWIADIYMSETSNTNPVHGVPQSDGNLLYASEAYDLPSSAAANGTLPNNEEDCNRFVLTENIYDQFNALQGSTAFSLVSLRRWTGVWGVMGRIGTCGVTPTYVVGTAPIHLAKSDYNFNIYRFVVTATARSSFQEAAVDLWEPPPP